MPVRCPICTHETAEQARYCPRCGAALQEVPEPRVCSATRLSDLLLRWRRISASTTRKELRALLGEPLHIAAGSAVDTDTDAASRETWTYEYESAGRTVTGWVSVSSAEMRVVAWSEPDWRQFQPNAARD